MPSSFNLQKHEKAYAFGHIWASKVDLFDKTNKQTNCFNIKYVFQIRPSSANSSKRNHTQNNSLMGNFKEITRVKDEVSLLYKPFVGQTRIFPRIEYHGPFQNVKIDNILFP